IGVLIDDMAKPLDAVALQPMRVGNRLGHNREAVTDRGSLAVADDRPLSQRHGAGTIARHDPATLQHVAQLSLNERVLVGVKKTVPGSDSTSHSCGPMTAGKGTGAGAGAVCCEDASCPEIQGWIGAK